MPPGAAPNLRRGGGPRNTLERRWWLWGLARELGRLSADLIHGPDFSVPYIPARPSVLTLHDLSPWMEGQWHANAHRVRRRTPMLLEMGVATMVITPTESVRKQAIDRFRLRPIAWSPYPKRPRPGLRPVAPRVPAGRRYFLFVGTIEPRKNLATLVDAWREVRRDHAVDLVIAGRRRADAPADRARARPATAWRGSRRATAGALFRRPGIRLSIALRRLRIARLGSDAMRRLVIASRAVAEVAGEAAIYADPLSNWPRRCAMSRCRRRSPAGMAGTLRRSRAGVHVGSRRA